MQLDLAAILIAVLSLIISVGSFYYARREAIAAEDANSISRSALKNSQEVAAKEALARTQARLSVRREAQRDLRGQYFFVVVNEGEATARSIGFQITSTALGDSNILRGPKGMTNFVRKAEIRPHDHWKVAIHGLLSSNICPVAGRLNWQDDSESSAVECFSILDFNDEAAL